MDDRAVVEAFMRRHAQYLARTVAAVVGLWDQLPGYNRGDLASWLEAVVPLVEAQQSQAGPMVDGYVAKLAGASPVGVTGLVDLRGGVSTAEVYERPFLRAWKLMGEGMPRPQAVAKARTYAADLAQMDGQLAVSHATAEVVDRQPTVVGYRRVLTGASCRFCAAASTQRYRGRDSAVARTRYDDLTAEWAASGRAQTGAMRVARSQALGVARQGMTGAHLRPLHTKCDCGVAPIFGDRDPGHVINKELLDNLKAQGPQYWAKRGFVDAKGNPIDPTDLGRARTDLSPELGPVLVTA